MIFGFGYCMAIALTGAALDDPTDLAIRQAASAGLKLIEASTKEYPKHRSCFSCHHQAVPVQALVLGKKAGLPVDDENLQAQLELTRDDLESARKEYLAGKGQPGGTTRAGYALFTLAKGEWPADETTDAVTDFLLKKDKDQGFWRTSSNRPPSEASEFTSTYLSLVGLKAFGRKLSKSDLKARIELSRAWIAKTEGKDTEDRVFRLLAASAASSDASQIKNVAEKLRAAQRTDGGWSQVDQGASDAYATGSALVTLHTVAGLSSTDPAYQRGLAFLLKTQLADGSWHVVSRSKPFQPYFESGFPHKKDQFISIAASAWATSALILAIKPEPSKPVGPGANPPELCRSISPSPADVTSGGQGSISPRRFQSLEPLFVLLPSQCTPTFSK